jgi:hypothetical protein
MNPVEKIEKEFKEILEEYKSNRERSRNFFMLTLKADFEKVPNIEIINATTGRFSFEYSGAYSDDFEKWTLEYLNQLDQTSSDCLITLQSCKVMDQHSHVIVKCTFLIQKKTEEKQNISKEGTLFGYT